MDLFSLGCVLAELFSDDTPNSSMFDLGQILMFKKNQYQPNKFIDEGIEDSRIRRLILNLTDLEPSKRNSATYHLEQLVPSLFPAYFHNLYDYFANLIPLPAEAKIFILNKDLDKLMNEIITEDEHGLLLPLILATSTLRSLKSTEAKLVGLKLCVRLVESSPSVMSEYTIDRLLPYIMQLIAKSESRVKALCVSSLKSVLSHIDKLQPGDANVFIDYILPSLQPLAYDNSTLVRISLASHISELAQISKRFLDVEDKESNDKLNLLQEAFGAIVSQLLIDPNNNVRRAILNENISKLCDFFGKEKTDEVILSHIITFLNDKGDFRLRAAFFENINRIGTSLGPYYAPVVKPLMQKGLADSEEIVIFTCLKAITSMTEVGLLTKDVVYELFQEAVPLLSFPNKWIRNAVINFVLVLSKSDLSFDFNRRILPAIKLHLDRDIHGLRDEMVLLDSLQNPLPRVVIESILNGENIDELFTSITKRKMARDKRRYRMISATDTQDFDVLSEDLAQNRSGDEILTSVDRSSEDKLIDSELILRRIHKNKHTSSSRMIEPNISVKGQDAILQSQFNMDSRLLMSSTISLTRTTRPRGVLLAQLQEHKAAVNQLIVIPGATHFISCSNDATIKFWDCAGVSTKPQVLFRSKQTFISPDAGAVINMSVCMGADTLLSLTESNNLHLLQLYSPSSHSRVIKSVNFNSDLINPELVTSIVSLSPFTYATCSTSSNLRGYDLRLPTTSDVWNMKMEGGDGLITCMDGNEFCLACGTSSSVISMFDLRFYIRATTMRYPLYQEKTRKRIRRILLCNDEIYCSVDGNNEVSTWDCESASRTKTLWASPHPCLSTTESTHYSVLDMIVDSSRDTNSIITAGDDMKIRFWDLNSPHRSYLVNGPSINKHHAITMKNYKNSPDRSDRPPMYQMKLVDGVQVIRETDKVSLNIPAQNSSPRSTPSNQQVGSESGNDLSPNSLNSDGTSACGSNSTYAHHDSISCLATVNQSSLLLSASRDGVIKIWR